VPTLAAAVAGRSAVRRLLPTALFLAALAAGAVALARPEATVAVPVERASVVLVTDASRSMLAEDVEPNRLTAAQEASESFLDRVPDELRVGVVGYSTTPHTLLPPTTEHDQARATVAALSADGGTATGDALESALEMLSAGGEQGTRPPAAIVLLSDGRATTGRDPVEVAHEAASADIPVHTVALGTSSATVPAPDGLGQLPAVPDRESLRQVAQASGGEAFAVEDGGELDAIYEELGSQIGTRDEQREITAGFAGAAIALLLVGVGLAQRWAGRLP
jgi:Ca-activated chloride channel family protein